MYVPHAEIYLMNNTTLLVCTYVATFVVLVTTNFALYIAMMFYESVISHAFSKLYVPLELGFRLVCESIN